MIIGHRFRVVIGHQRSVIGGHHRFRVVIGHRRSSVIGLGGSSV
jgi:hypothetical protein